ncbi:hypothetical protein [Spirosoma jeollabukense]
MPIGFLILFIEYGQISKTRSVGNLKDAYERGGYSAYEPFVASVAAIYYVP